MNEGVTRAEAPVCSDLLTTRCTQVGETTQSCDEVNEGLVSHAATVQRRRRAGQSSLPKFENWLSVNLGFPKV